MLCLGLRGEYGVYGHASGLEGYLIACCRQSRMGEEELRAVVVVVEQEFVSSSCCLRRWLILGYVVGDKKLKRAKSGNILT